MIDGIKVTLAVIIIILLIVFIPLSAIWAMNGLFDLGLEYSFMNWFYVVILGGFFRGSSSIGRQ